MKNMTLLLVLCSFAFSTYAKDYEFHLVKPRPIGSTDFPTLDGFSLSASYEMSGENLYFEFKRDRSNENGVCKALGYEKALRGSSRGTYFSLSNVVVVNSNGSIVSGRTKAKKITKITCINIVKKALSRSFLFFSVNVDGNPIHACISREPVEAKKDADKTCRALGYDRSFMYERNSYGYDNNCNVINEQGEIIAKQTGDSGDAIRKLGCVK